MLPNLASNLLDGPDSVEEQVGQLTEPTDHPITTDEYLTFTQGEYFLMAILPHIVSHSP